MRPRGLGGYITMAVVALLLVAVVAFTTYRQMHPGRSSAFRSEWRCSSSVFYGELCERNPK